ncbi:MAG: 2-oxopent-4-enoate hydratase [Deltaproteobacteria bacterium]|nr:MAG: 2-oxopent-4-enoate hydratase [Deltaproteobacteria bacterium]
MVERYGEELFRALRERRVVAPLKGRVDGLDIDMAYAISDAMLQRRLADGERIIGRKIGVTSRAVQDMLGVHQPDFGTLTDAMVFHGEMPVSKLLIQPRAEGEIAFTLARDLVGPGITPEDVLAATKSVHACFEVVDSRIADWKIGIEDTVADNASSGLFAIGEGVDPAEVDFEGCHMVVHKNGARLSEGYGRAALGSPLICVAWLANTFGARGIALKAGDVVLSGSLVPLEPVVAGDHMHVAISGIGELDLRFT